MSGPTYRLLQQRLLERLGRRTNALTNFSARNGVSTRDMNLCGAQRLAYVLLCRRFAAALAGDSARLEVDVDRYSFIVSDLHRLLIGGLPAHCERLWTLPNWLISHKKEFSSWATQ